MLLFHDIVTTDALVNSTKGCQSSMQLSLDRLAYFPFIKYTFKQFSKKNTFRGNYPRKYGTTKSKDHIMYKTVLVLSIQFPNLT